MDELPLELHVDQVRQLQSSGTPFVLLDCRRPDEYERAHLADAAWIPMQELNERVGELEADRENRIVVYCHHGGRSLRVAQWLRQQGFSGAQSMAGGIDAWSEQIDSSIPRY